MDPWGRFKCVVREESGAVREKYCCRGRRGRCCVRRRGGGRAVIVL